MTAIAREAGVSQPTVSMVLSGRAAEFRIPPETAARVREVAKKLGYRPRVRKARLKGTRHLAAPSGKVCVIFVEYRSLTGDLLYSPAYLGLCRAATGHEIASFGGMTWEGMAEFLASDALSDCAGVVLFTHRDPPAETYEPFDRLGVPWILVNRDPDGLRSPRVVMDSFGMAYGLMEDLLRKGHRRIALLGTDRSITSAVGQRNGYREALAAAGCYDPDLEILRSNNPNDEDYRHDVAEILRRAPDVTAFYSFFDLNIRGVYEAVRATGRRIPEDVSIVATGGQPAAQLVDPPLTTVRYPMMEMGEAAFKLLERIWRGESVPERTVIPGELWAGGSSASAPQREQVRGA